MRIAADVVNIVRKHEATVHFACGKCNRANACSILELITLGAAKGAEIKIIAEGQDEKVVTEKLINMFDQGEGI